MEAGASGAPVAPVTGSRPLLVALQLLGPGLLDWRPLSGNPLSTDLISVLLGANLLILPAPSGPCTIWMFLIPSPLPAPSLAGGGGVLSALLGGRVVAGPVTRSWCGWDLFRAPLLNPREDSGGWRSGLGSAPAFPVRGHHLFGPRVLLHERRSVLSTFPTVKSGFFPTLPLARLSPAVCGLWPPPDLG